MKKLLLIICFLFAGHCFAQDVNKLISQTDVQRIISTLAADDMQGRATFTPGIEKAAEFIESEYKAIGLLGNIASTIRAIALSSRTIVSGEDTPKRVAKLER